MTIETKLAASLKRSRSKETAGADSKWFAKLLRTARITITSREMVNADNLNLSFAIRAQGGGRAQAGNIVTVLEDRGYVASLNSFKTSSISKYYVIRFELDSDAEGWDDNPEGTIYFDPGAGVATWTGDVT